MLGSSVKEVLEAHQEKGEGMFKGIRHAAGWDKSKEVRNSHTDPIEHIYLNNKFQRGIEELSNLRLTFDAWHYHNQIQELTSLAINFPDLVIIHDHLGGPLGIGPYTNMRESIFKQWKEDISKLSLCKNVYMKLGGLAMPINGWNWHKRKRPASSDEIVEFHSPYYLHAINEFGTDRCMFESNFPVDKQSISYSVLWNGFKKMSQSFSDVEIHNLFFQTAKRVYSL
jgi:predicted TIM-barrel fold metal-dependent hydrolase